MIRILILSLLLLLSSFSWSQTSVYSLDTKEDVALMGLGAGLTAVGLVMKANVDLPTLEDISVLNASEINGFDRFATENNSQFAAKTSDVLLYGTVAFPILSSIFQAGKQDRIEVGVMALETFLISHGITTMTKASVQRFRPFNYNIEVPTIDKLTRNARLSFISGHTSKAAAFSFFGAKVFSDMNPDSPYKPWVWGAAIGVPALVGIARVEAGSHFPTDVIAGYAVGAIVGFLIPEIHRNKDVHITMGANNMIGLTYTF